MTARRPDRRPMRQLEAEERQAAYDRDVARVAYEQNVSWSIARDVARGRKRFEHLRRTRDFPLEA